MWVNLLSHPCEKKAFWNWFYILWFINFYSIASISFSATPINTNVHVLKLKLLSNRKMNVELRADWALINVLPLGLENVIFTNCMNYGWEKSLINLNFMKPITASFNAFLDMRKEVKILLIALLPIQIATLLRLCKRWIRFWNFPAITCR